MEKRGTPTRIAQAGVALAAVMVAGPALAAGDLAGAAMEGAKHIPALMTLVQKITPIVGAVLVLSAVIAATRIETGKATVKQVMWTLAVGSLMVALGNSINVMDGTFGYGAGDKNNILAANLAQANGGGMCGPIGGVMAWIQFLGLIGFVRGLHLWHKHGSGKEDDGFWRGMTHVVGGSMAMNITTTATIFAHTFGFTAMLKALCM